MKMLLKIAKWFGLVLLLLVVFLLAHPLWIGSVVRGLLPSLISGNLGVEAKLDSFSLNLYTGHVSLDGLVIDNPPACGEEKFLTLGHFETDFETTSLLSDTIVIENVSVQDLYMSFMVDGQGTYNIMLVKNHKQKEEPEPEKPAPEEPAPADGETSSTKVVIDRLEINNTLVQWRAVSIPLPSFTLTGIGRESQGMDFDVAWNEIRTQFFEACGPSGRALRTTLDEADAWLKAGKKMVDQAKEASRAALDGAKGVLDNTKGVLDESKGILDGAKKLVTSPFGK